MSADTVDWRRPLFKVVLLGESNVGKSSIFLRIKDNVFSPSLQPTVGIESCVKVVRVEDEKVSLAIWDTAGVEKFKTMTRNYYRRAHAAVLIYDVNDPASLQYLAKWANDSLEYAPDALRFLVGNKKDLERMILTESLENFNYTHNCECIMFTSAKTGEGIDEALYMVAQKLLGAFKTPLFYESHYDSTVEIYKTRYSDRRPYKQSKLCCF